MSHWEQRENELKEIRERYMEQGIEVRFISDSFGQIRVVDRNDANHVFEYLPLEYE